MHTLLYCPFQRLLAASYQNIILEQGFVPYLTTLISLNDASVRNVDFVKVGVLTKRGGMISFDLYAMHLVDYTSCVDQRVRDSGPKSVMGVGGMIVV